MKICLDIHCCKEGLIKEFLDSPTVTQLLNLNQMQILPDQTLVLAKEKKTDLEIGIAWFTSGLTSFVVSDYLPEY